MAQLSSTDLGAALRAAALLGEIATRAEFPAATLRIMRELIDADMATYNRMAVGRAEALFVADPDFDTTAAEEVLAHYAQQNPLVHNVVTTGDMSARRFSDFLTRTEYHNSAIYTDLYRGFDVEYQMAAVVTGAAELFIGIGFNRKERDFSDRDRDLLNVMVPHITAAHARVGWRELALGGRPGVALQLDSRRRVATIRGPAADWIREITGAHVVAGGRLPDDLDVWVLEQLRTLTHPRRNRPPTEIRLGTPDDGLRVRCVPEVGGTVLLLERRGVRPAIRQLRRGLALTGRQAEVLWWLTRGASTVDVAGRLGISPATVTTHVNHILRRLGVRSRVEATALARDVLEVLG